MNPDGSNPTELTNEQIPFPSKSLPPTDYAAKWSPDGTKIAFLSYRDFVDSDPSPYTIYVMDYQGGGVQRINLDGLLSLSPVNCTEIDSFEWSPDGSKFVLDAGDLITGIGSCAPKSSTEIYTVNMDGTELVKLTRDTNPSSSTYFMNTSPTWSPDGRQVAFASWNQNGEGANTIEAMNADGSNRRHIIHYGYQDTIKGVSWSADGSKILFVGPPRYGTCANYSCSELYVINPDGSELTQLTHYPASYGTYSGPRWSPDGTKIVFERQLTDPFTHQLISNYAIFVMDADGSNQINISNRKSNLGPMDAEPDWQPLLASANEPPPSVLGFDSGIYLATYPNPPSVQVVATRSGNLNQAVTCDYQVSDGNITSGLPSGTLTFAPGETSKTIPFSSYYFTSQPRTCNVSLFNNGGNATFVRGIKDASIVFVGDNANPIDSSVYFVRQHYRDFLNREPDASGWDFWTNNIDSCGSFNSGCSDPKRIDTSAAFFLSIEFQQTGYLVYRTYKVAYSNLPGAPVPIRFNEFLADTQQIGQGVVVGQAGWEQALETNKQNFMASFVQRSRFISAYPTTLTPAQFVDRFAVNANVTLPSTDLATAINEFGSATDTKDVTARSRALRDLAESATVAQQEFNRAFVLMEYFGYLRRDPNTSPDADFSGYNFWLSKLNAFSGDYQKAEMVKAFLVSGEYRNRFGP
jgi:WD40-like Beta Propeller Repeat